MIHKRIKTAVFSNTSY